MVNFLGFFWFSLGLLLQSSYPPAFPRENATKVLENDRVIIWDAVWPKGKPTPMHLHTHDAVAVTIEDGAVTNKTPDGVISGGAPSLAGEALFRDKGVVHSEEGVSDKPRRVIAVELKDVMVPPTTKTRGFPNAFPRAGGK